MDEPTPFRRYLLTELRSRDTRSLFFRPPNSYYQIAINQRAVTSDDLFDIADYLGVSFESIHDLYMRSERPNVSRESIDLYALVEAQANPANTGG